MAEKVLAESDIVWPLSYVYSLRRMCHLERELYICLPIENLVALTC
jgi:hypothetical protein